MARRWKSGEVAVVDTGMCLDDDGFGIGHGVVVRIEGRFDEQCVVVRMVGKSNVRGTVDDVDLISLDEGMKKGYAPALKYAQGK